MRIKLTIASIASVLIGFLPMLAMAADEHGHGGGIPTRTIMWQVFNLGILVAAIIFFGRKPVKDLFIGRRAQFLETADKTKAAREKAEANFLEIKGKIEQLESSRLETMARAEADASDLRKQMIKDAEEIAARVRHEAKTTVTMETQRAQRQIREQFVQEAIGAATMVLTKDIGGQDHQKLQGEFVDRIEAVTP